MILWVASLVWAHLRVTLLVSAVLTKPSGAGWLLAAAIRQHICHHPAGQPGFFLWWCLQVPTSSKRTGLNGQTLFNPLLFNPHALMSHWPKQFMWAIQRQGQRDRFHILTGGPAKSHCKEAGRQMRRIRVTFAACHKAGTWSYLSLFHWRQGLTYGRVIRKYLLN